jgi:UDP-glucose:(heptosyl)LPS alpha-1,3-glucosyltransferase
MSLQKKIKIALVRQRFTPYGGSEKILDRVIKSLSAHEYISVTVMTRFWPIAPWANSNFYIEKCNPPYIGRFLRDWLFDLCVCRKAHKGNFDIVLSFEKTPCADIYRAGDGVHKSWLEIKTRSLSLLRKLPYIFSPYHNYLLSKEKKIFYSEKTKFVIANSLFVKGEIDNFFPQKKPSTIVLRNGVDTRKFNPRLKINYKEKVRNELKLGEEVVIFLFVGSGYARKGLFMLIDIFTTLPQNYHLLCIGKDKNINKAKTRSKHFSNISILGKREEITQFLGAADAFVFPSMYDPSPNSVLEALASGVPVICSSATGISDYAGRNGVTLLNPLEKNQWRDEIVRFGKRIIEHEPILQPTIKFNDETNKLIRILNESIKNIHQSQ